MTTQARVYINQKYFHKYHLAAASFLRCFLETRLNLHVRDIVRLQCPINFISGIRGWSAHWYALNLLDSVRQANINSRKFTCQNISSSKHPNRHVHRHREQCSPAHNRRPIQKCNAPAHDTTQHNTAQEQNASSTYVVWYDYKAKSINSRCSRWCQISWLCHYRCDKPAGLSKTSGMRK